MTDSTPLLGLPFIQPNQAQKHVTHNEAIATLDAVIQLSIDAFDIVSVPTELEEGSVYALANSPVGEFALYGDHLAAWTGFGWVFVAPKTGWRAWSKADATLMYWTGSSWDSFGGSENLNNISGVGIGTSYDTTNALAVASAASLFTHVGQGHQLKINKAAATDTGSLLFQSNWSGRAEMGLMGNDNFEIKISPDGSNFQTSLKVNADSGIVDATAIRSTVVSIDDDSVLSVPCPSAGGICAISVVHSNIPEPSHSGLISYDVGGSPALVTLAIGTKIENLGVAALNGSTGTDGNSVLAVTAGHIVIENRSGATRNYSLTFLGGL